MRSLATFCSIAGGLSHETTRNRTLAVGKRIEQELCDEVDAPQPIVEPAPQMVVGIDGAFVNAVRTKSRERLCLAKIAICR